MTELDKFKRRLIRALASKMEGSNMPDEQIWVDLKRDTGCDCEMLWKRMVSLSVKKMNRLISTNDRNDTIAIVARLDTTDWLLFDLVLVHNSKIDVTTYPGATEEPTILQELFMLVQQHNIEGLRGEQLAKAWVAATEQYNSRYARECTPMLLQRRWYQLKERVREKFYDFWFTYRGNTKLLDIAKEKHMPSPLFLTIAKRYHGIITQKFPDWETAIKEKLIILPENFSSAMRHRNLHKPTCDPDIVVLEPNIETINVEDSGSEDNDNDKVPEIPTVTVKKEPKENECLSVIEDSDSSVDVEKSIRSKKYFEMMYNTVSLKVETQETNFANDENYINALPKITDVQGNIATTDNLNADNLNENDGISVIGTNTKQNITKTVDDNNQMDDIEDQVDFVDNILQNTLKTMQEKDQMTPKPKDKVIENMLTDLNSIIEQKTNDFVSKVKTDLNPFEASFEPNALDIVDGGIELADDGVALEEDDIIIIQANEGAPDTNHEINENSDVDNASDDAPKFDLKLLMYPVVYTLKLDLMSDFQSTPIGPVSDAEKIDRIMQESKPISKQAVQINATQEHENVKSDSDTEENIVRVKINSHLLQKPKSREYNPIQLCKNPDFNTRLKRLTVGFISSTRNRRFLKACKPLTIDLDKGFESKLVDGTLYLKTNTPITTGETIRIEDENNQAMSIVPSAMSVQSLIDNIVTKDIEQELVNTKKNIEQELINTQHLNDSPTGSPTEETLLPYRRKAVNLPDINNVRRINQQLLTAEVVPMRPSDTTKASETSVQKKQPPKRNVPNWFTNNRVLHAPYDKDILVTDDSLVKMIFALDNETKDITVPNTKKNNKTKKMRDILNKKSKRNVTRIINVDEDDQNTVDDVNSKESFINDDIMDLVDNDEHSSNNNADSEGTTTKELTKEDSIKPKETKKKSSTRKPKKVITNIIKNPKGCDTKQKGQEKLPRSTSYCCWAREKMVTMQTPDAAHEKKISIHNCTFPLCTCCCKLFLADIYRSSYSSATVTLSGFERSNTDLKNKDTDFRTNKETKANQSDNLITTEVIKQQVLATDAEKTKAATIDISDDEENDKLVIDEHGTQNYEQSKADNAASVSSQTNLNQPLIVRSGPSLYDRSNKSVENSIEIMNKTPALNVTTLSNLTETALPKVKPLTSLDNLTSLPVYRKNNNNILKNTNSSFVLCPIGSPANAKSPPSLPVVSVISPSKLFPDTSNKSPATPNLSNQGYQISIDAPKRSIVIDGSTGVIRDPFNQTPHSIKNIPDISVPKITTDSAGKVTFLDAKLISKTPTESPIFLGKNKILLTTVKFPHKEQNIPKEIVAKNVALLPIPVKESLPKAVQLVLLPTGKLTYHIPPDVELSADDFSNLKNILASAQKSLDNSQGAFPSLNSFPSLNTSDINVQMKDNNDDNTSRLSESCVNMDGEIPQLEKQATPNPQGGLCDTNERNDQVADESKKTILSDLMNMLGISADDTSVEPKPSHTTPLPETAVDPETLPTFSTLHELTPITSLAELRYACQKRGKFFKLDFVTGVIAPINVSIKKNMKWKTAFKDNNPESIIDLTEEMDNDEDPASIESSSKRSPESTTKTSPQSLLKPSEEYSSVKIVKPLKLFKALHPSILKRNRLKLNGKQKDCETESKKNEKDRKRKQNLNKKIEAKIDLVDSDGPMEEEYLINSSDSEHEQTNKIVNEVEENDDDSSDDEPLAKKVKRKQVQLKSKKIMEIDPTNDENNVTAKEAEHEETDVGGNGRDNNNSSLVPELMEVPAPPLDGGMGSGENDDGTESDDCILGV